VVVMDHVSVGDNTILQNSILGTGCRVGENCNLNDCQVAPGRVVVAGTKEKGESFTVE
jgi:translation initiation factor eIF-2B subunit gamma